MQIRNMTAADIPALCEIEKACFSTPWSAAAFADELSNPAARFTVAEQDGKVCGYLGLLVTGDEGYFTNIAVSPAYRRHGVGAALMQDVCDFGKAQKFYRLTLEVRVSNIPARRLYERFGFVSDGVRPHFYRQPDEHAEIYSLYYNK